jgi:endo-1,4-beta-xylanase
MVDWAMEKGLKIKGHVLCWHVTTPDYVEKMGTDQIREELKRHIFTTMGHFRGRIKCWDVVNESLAPDGSLAQNIFLRYVFI